MKLITNGIYYKGTVDGMSPHYPTKYEPGATVEADSLDTNTTTDCAHGLHVCDTIADALRWGKDVFRVKIPEDATMVRAGSKLRVDRLDVVEQVNLRSADLSSADLSYADLSSADLRSADLRSADLSSANLRSADLRSADLRSANLRSADLRSADLRSADLSYADLRSAVSSQLTLWPEGFDIAGARVKVL